jgi:hypothetical protein
MVSHSFPPRRSSDLAKLKDRLKEFKDLYRRLEEVHKILKHIVIEMDAGRSPRADWEVVQAKSKETCDLYTNIIEIIHSAGLRHQVKALQKTRLLSLKKVQPDSEHIRRDMQKVYEMMEVAQEYIDGLKTVENLPNNTKNFHVRIPNPDGGVSHIGYKKSE